MESNVPGRDSRPSAAEAAHAVGQAGAATLSTRLTVPPFLYEWVGAAVAVQIASFGWAFAPDRSALASLLVIAAGGVLFVAVAVWQVGRFRRRNGVRIDALSSRAVYGASAPAVLGYAAGMAMSAWAGISGVWPAGIFAGILAGAVYAWAGRRWWSAYQNDPANHVDGLSRWATLGIVAVAVVGFALLALVGR